MIEFANIDKGFSGVRVLKDVSFALAAGHTLGLVGENGAGKSTLTNILGGNHQPDAGQMRLDGQPYAPRHPTDATRRGVAFIHQELNLFPNLSIAENIFLTDFPLAGAGAPNSSSAADAAGGGAPGGRGLIAAPCVPAPRNFSARSDRTSRPKPWLSVCPPASGSWSRSPRP